MKRKVQMIVVGALLLGPGIARSQAALMYGISASAGAIWTVDTDTAAFTAIAGMPAHSSTAGAYDIDENRIYTFNNATNELYSIDPVNGTGFAVGVIPYNFVQGFAYDPINDVLYGHDKDTASLFTINTADASTTYIGFTNWGWAGGIEYDYINGILYGLEATDYTGSGARLATINTTTAAVTAIGSIADLGSQDYQMSLGFNPDDGMLYTSVEHTDYYDGTYEFVRINPVTLETTLVGTTTKRLSGLCYIPEPGTMSLLGFGMLRLITRRRKRK